MHFTSTTVLDDSDLTVHGERSFKENDELSINSFGPNARYAFLRSDLVLFIANYRTTYILKNRYGNTGIVNTGE